MLLTSRVSVEMVQKAAMMGAPIVVAVSAPTALAVRTAEAAGITLVAIARDDGFEVFTHARPHRHRERSSMSPDKLVYMANQIGKFFAHQAGGARRSPISPITCGNSGTRACARRSSTMSMAAARD